MNSSKPLPITKAMVWAAYKLVKTKGRAAGVDGQSLDDFANGLEDNLYQLWNRMASGSYFPPPVRRVEIPKVGGGSRPLGIPTVADRIAQMVVKQRLEPELDHLFDPDSYGYRPGKSAHQAVEQARKRCWQQPARRRVSSRNQRVGNQSLDKVEGPRTGRRRNEVV